LRDLWLPVNKHYFFFEKQENGSAKGYSHCVPRRRDRVRVFNVAMAENTASCEVRGLVFDGTFSTVAVTHRTKIWAELAESSAPIEKIG
jgi:hypothetical protein